jgi:hypothetical protein
MFINYLLTPFNGHTDCRLSNPKFLRQNALADTKFTHGPITYDTTSLHDFFIRLVSKLDGLLPKPGISNSVINFRPNFVPQNI